MKAVFWKCFLSSISAVCEQDALTVNSWVVLLGLLGLAMWISIGLFVGIFLVKSAFVFTFALI